MYVWWAPAPGPRTRKRTAKDDSLEMGMTKADRQSLPGSWGSSSSPRTARIKVTVTRRRWKGLHGRGPISHVRLKMGDLGTQGHDPVKKITDKEENGGNRGQGRPEVERPKRRNPCRCVAPTSTGKDRMKSHGGCWAVASDSSASGPPADTGRRKESGLAKLLVGKWEVNRADEGTCRSAEWGGGPQKQSSFTRTESSKPCLSADDKDVTAKGPTQVDKDTINLGPERDDTSASKDHDLQDS